MADRFLKSVGILVMAFLVWLIVSYVWIDWLAFYLRHKFYPSLEFGLWSISTIIASYSDLLLNKQITYFDYLDYIFFRSPSVPLLMLTIFIIANKFLKEEPKVRYIRGAKWAAKEDLKKGGLL